MVQDVSEEGKPEPEESKLGFLRCVDYLRSTQRERPGSTSYLVGLRSHLARHSHLARPCRRRCDVRASASLRQL